MLRLVTLLLVCAASIAAAAEKPNIVLILADDLGINDLSCYGRKDQATPNLDRLATEGVRFTSAYCAQPICSASRAALLTGKSPARLHLTNFLPGRADAPSQKLLQPVIEGQLPLEEVTLAELLFGVTHEGAADVADLLDRRTRVGLVPADHTLVEPLAVRALAVHRVSG